MTHVEQYSRSLEDTFAESLLTIDGKREDYAEETDVFSNFRFAAQAAGVTVEQVFLVLLGVKLARLKNLLVTRKDGEIINESIEDTLVDSINYTAILKAYRELKNSTAPDYAYAAAPTDEEYQKEDEYESKSVYDEPANVELELIEPAVSEQDQEQNGTLSPVAPPSAIEQLRTFFRLP